MEIESFVVEKDYKSSGRLITWCRNNIVDYEIKEVYYTNVIPERTRFIFKNEEDFVLFKLTWG